MQISRGRLAILHNINACVNCIIHIWCIGIRTCLVADNIKKSVLADPVRVLWGPCTLSSFSSEIKGMCVLQQHQAVYHSDKCTSNSVCVSLTAA